MRIIKVILGVFDNAKDFDDAYWESKYNEQNATEVTTEASADVITTIPEVA